MSYKNINKCDLLLARGIYNWASISVEGDGGEKAVVYFVGLCFCSAAAWFSRNKITRSYIFSIMQIGFLLPALLISCLILVSFGFAIIKVADPCFKL